jgi:hypothetical protein
MKRRLYFALAWVGLFGVVLGIRVLADKPLDTSDAVAAERVLKEIHSELESIPRKNAFLLASSGSNAEVDILNERLSIFLRTHEDGLRRCRERIMKRSKRITEYFELSFFPRYTDFNSRRVRLDDATLERSTLSLNTDEAHCIVEEFSLFEFESETIPQGRVAYQICFRTLAY